MKLDRIITTLNLVGSNTREETIRSMIENSLYAYGEPIDQKNLQDVIRLDFGISLFENELFNTIESLQNEQLIQVVENSKIRLSDERHRELLKIEIGLKEEETKRKAALIGIFNSHSDRTLSQEELNLLVNTFTEYINECFLEYGKKAISFFAPSQYEINQTSHQEIINSNLKKLSDINLNILFRNVINDFPNCISSDFLDYLEKLAKKTECFYSLGLTKDLHDEILNVKFIDWVVFLDTNFLYSILNLRPHPESYACKELIKLVNQYHLNIRFTYISETRKELLNKRDEFKTNILGTNFTPGQIRALLQSEKLDDFSKSYFENKLKDPETPHPTEIVDDHIIILKNQNIQIYQSKFKHLSEDFIKEQISKFRDYERMRNEVRYDKKLPMRYEKDLDLLEHDIFLREAVLSLRNHRATSLNEIKYFALTLDKALIGYDKQDTNRSDRPIKIPAFFLPSFFLSKITKFLPVITDDYKRAFITAISSIAFEQSNKKVSYSLQQSVKKFHNMGITDEGLILSCVSQKVFLDDFEKLKNENDQENFIESAINKKIEELQNDKKRLSSQLEYTHEKIRQFKSTESEKNDVIEKLNDDIKEIISTQRIYESELKKAKKLLTQQKDYREAFQQEMVFNAPEPVQEKNNDGDQITISINLKKIKKWYSKTINVFSKIILGMNIIGFLFIVLTGILLNEYVKSMPVAGLGLSLLLFLIPSLKAKDIAFKIVNICILIIYFVFIVFNWNDLIKILNN